MTDFNEIAAMMNQFADAIDSGFQRFMVALPTIVIGKIETEAMSKLGSTLDQYNDALRLSFDNSVLVVGIDPESWLANALEVGAPAFDMKSRLETSKKTKTSKAGYKYMSIPIGKKEGASGGSTDKGQDIQNRINAIMNKPKFGLSQLKTLQNGQQVEMQQVMSSDPSLQLSGLYRTRNVTPGSSKGSGAFSLVLFRTMSNKPGSADWYHPGIKGNDILKGTGEWLETAIPTMVQAYIKQALEKVDF